MFKDVLQRLGMGAVAVILAAFAGGIAFVALAYGLFALLESHLSPAAAAAITAGVFAVVAAALAVLVPTVAPKKADVATLKPKLDQRTIALATEARSPRSRAAQGASARGEGAQGAQARREKPPARREETSSRTPQVVDPPPPLIRRFKHVDEREHRRR
jgi:hypothetical protein